VRYGSWVINFFTVTKLAPLLLFLAVGLFYIEPGNFDGMLDIGGADLGAAVLMLMFAFGGYELITIPASESRSPRRDAPRALLLTIGIVCAIYVLVQLVAAGTLPGLAQSDTPLADSAEMFMGPAFGILIAIGGLLSIGGSNAGSMLAGPRLTYAMGEKGQLPAIFAHVHRRFRTPDVSILVFAGIALALAMTGTFAQLATLSAVARIVFYMATCAAVPVLRRKVEARDDAFELPGGPLVPALALIVSVVILAGAGMADLEAIRAGAGMGELLALPMVGGGLALVAGAILYFVARSSPR
jgi:amino acid transporter